MEEIPYGPATLATWLHAQLSARGYDLSTRGGARTRFADDSGIGRATISRILNGQGATDIRVLTQLAAALGTPLGTVLIIAGLVTPDDLQAIQHPHPNPEQRITPEQAADRLGITDPTQRAVFLASVAALQRPPRPAEKPAD